MCKQHIQDRIVMAAQERAGMTAMVEGAPQAGQGELPQPGVQAVTAGPVPSQPAEIPQVADSAQQPVPVGPEVQPGIT